MEDREIMELFRKRSEAALSEIEKKYGRYCLYIAERILGSAADAEENGKEPLPGEETDAPRPVN